MQGTTDNIYIQMILGMSGAFILVVSFILFSIRNQNRLLRQRQQFQQAQIAHQKELLGAVILSQEAERKRIGQDLHDDVGTTLSGLRLLIEMFKPANDKDPHYLDFVRSSKSTIDKIVKDVRHISHNLSPATLGYYGLAAAINEHSDIINQSGRLTIDVINDADALLESLPLPTATALYRVLEELLNNTIKHSGASKAEIHFIEKPNTLFIAYKDNGKGLSGSSDQLKKGMGMQNIESRLTNINASYNVTTKPGEGFHVEINYPVIN
jgi:signal transduction histidine kinase